MSKGIAIRTILLIIVGLLTAVLIIYWIYSVTRSPILTATECQTRLMNWCTNCMNAQWDNGVYMPDDVKECVSLAGPGFGAFSDNNCCSDVDCADGKSSGLNKWDCGHFFNIR